MFATGTQSDTHNSNSSVFTTQNMPLYEYNDYITGLINDSAACSICLPGRAYNVPASFHVY